jgi:hypothetical protein
MENKIYIIEIYSECCVCLEFLNVDLSKLYCCGNSIHTKCIYDMFVHERVNENKEVVFTCPLCRKHTNFKNVISLKDIKKYTNDKIILCKYKQGKFSKYLKLCNLKKFLITIFFVIIIYVFIKFAKIKL